jgi:ABC-type transport system substrate-binding protein
MKALKMDPRFRGDDRPRSLARRDTLKAAAALGLGLPALTADAQGDGTKTLRYAFEVAETGFDPAQISDLYSRIVTGHIFDALYRYDYLARPYRIVPDTAEAMPEVSADFCTWTLRVKPGIFFQDDPVFKGKRRELTAHDYVYSLKRFFDPRTKAPTYPSLAEVRMLGMAELRDAALKGNKPFDYVAEVEGLRALDRYTLQFRFERPVPRFLQTIAGGDLYGAVAREVVEAYGDAIPAHPVGTGPFRLAEWRRSSKIVLERNSTYRELYFAEQPADEDAEGQALLAKFRGRRLPMIDRVEVSIIVETQPRWLAFLNRQLDILPRLPYEFTNIAAPNGKLAPKLARQGVQMFRTLNADVTLTYFNMEDPVVGGYEPAKVALRRAIGLAIDIDREIRLFWRGQGIPAQSGLMPHTMGYDPAFISMTAAHDLSQAKALLDMYGYVDRDGDGWREQPDGSPLVLQWSTTPDQQSRQRDELRRKDMAALGIRVEFKAALWPENLRNARAGKLMVWNLGYSAASPDGQPSLDRGAAVHVGGQNLARFRDKRFDAIYERMRALPDGPEREQLFHEAKRLLAVFAPYRYHVHRILTDLAWPWLLGYRRQFYSNVWWQYVDIDLAEQAKAMA